VCGAYYYSGKRNSVPGRNAHVVYVVPTLDPVILYFKKTPLVSTGFESSTDMCERAHYLESGSEEVKNWRKKKLHACFVLNTQKTHREITIIFIRSYFRLDI
jgi:hypothetical protein